MDDDDDERIARCTELARRVVLSQEPHVDPETVTVEVWGEGEGCCATACSGRFTVDYHPRALDALEAALLALAAGGKITPQVQAAYDALLGKPDARVAELEAQLAGVLALSNHWEEEAREGWLEMSADVQRQLRECAAELRGRIGKEGA